MKKISFSERYGLQQAVLNGTKTMTRRIVPIGLYNQTDWKAVEEGDYEAVVDGNGDYHDIRCCGRYCIGEEVAVAQRYEEAIHPCDWVNNMLYEDDPGWKNKMFVRADLMPHRIRFTNIRVERLQDISDEDCLCEGIYEDAEEHGGFYTTPFYDFVGNKKDGFDSPREAFAALIDCISGRGTWQRNPWVFVYSFEKTK